MTLDVITFFERIQVAYYSFLLNTSMLISQFWVRSLIVPQNSPRKQQ